MPRAERIPGPAALLLALACLLAFPAPLPAAGPLEGTWLLVEQSYGKGGTDLAEGPPLALELFRQGEKTEGRIRTSDAATETPLAHGWPAWVAEGRVLPTVVLEKIVDREAGKVRARYQVKPSEGDDLVLEVLEEYRLEDGGSVLAGTVTVTFLKGSETRGGYVLHRRFERSR